MKVSFIIVPLGALVLCGCGPPDPSASAPAGPGSAAGSDFGPLEEADAYIAEQTAAGTIDKSNPAWRVALPAFKPLAFAPGRRIFWLLETSQGDIRIRLFSDTAPNHASSTLYLTRLGFYDGLIFHRVIPGFMAQGGCPYGKGMGNPGYQYEGEFAGGVSHDRPGLVSMANRGAGTDGSQFFITFAPLVRLDGKHTVIGEVTGGMDVVRKLEAAGLPGGTPRETLSIIRARIELEKPEADAE